MSLTFPDPFRAYRHRGKLVLEFDERRFCADAVRDGTRRLVDRDAFLAFVCDHASDLLHDDDNEDGPPTWLYSLARALGAEASARGAGVIPDDGSAALPIDQPPDLFSDSETRRLLGTHVKETAGVD